MRTGQVHSRGDLQLISGRPGSLHLLECPTGSKLQTRPSGIPALHQHTGPIRPYSTSSCSCSNQPWALALSPSSRRNNDGGSSNNGSSSNPRALTLSPSSRRGRRVLVVVMVVVIVLSFVVHLCDGMGFGVLL